MCTYSVYVRVPLGRFGPEPTSGRASPVLDSCEFSSLHPETRLGDQPAVVASVTQQASVVKRRSVIYAARAISLLAFMVFPVDFTRPTRIPRHATTAPIIIVETSRPRHITGIADNVHGSGENRKYIDDFSQGNRRFSLLQRGQDSIFVLQA